MTDRLLQNIKEGEGWRSKPYRDTKGKLTIGFGTLLEDGISKEEGEFLLMHRLQNIIDELIEKSFIDLGELPEVVDDALYEMAYTMGVPSLLGFTRMWAALADEDWKTASIEALDSKWARDVGKRRSSRISDAIASAEG